MRFAAKFVTNELNFSFCFILTQSIHVKNFFTNAMTGSLLTLIKSSLLTYLFTKKIINFILRHLNFSLPSDPILFSRDDTQMRLPTSHGAKTEFSFGFVTNMRKEKKISLDYTRSLFALFEVSNLIFASLRSKKMFVKIATE